MNEIEKTEAIETPVEMNPAADAAESSSPCTQNSASEDVAPEAVEESVAAEEAAVVAADRDPHRFHSLSKEELRDELKAILERDDMEAHRDVTAIKQAFFSLRSKETLEELNRHIEEGNAPDSFVATPCAIEAEMKDMYAQFKERRAAHIEAEEAFRRENLAKKEAILEQMKAIAGDIDTVNVKFQEFKQLQQDFKAIKEVPATAETEIWKTFQTVGEQFYDHLKMNKELRDLDFKKNLEAKRAIIDSAVKLAEEKDVLAAFRSLQGLHEEWRNIGPVAKEIRDSIWDEFKTASATVNRRHQEYFEQRKAAEQANEEAKTALCEEVEAIDFSGFKSFNDWNKATESVIAIQKKWREYGFASRKANTALYARFRKACDDFFAAKTAYFQKTKDEFAANLEKKTRLCEKVEALRDSSDLQAAMAEVVKLQNEWKTIGSVPRKQSDALWERFTSACNYFFDKRKEQSKERRKEEAANMEAKKGIIAALAELPKDGDRREVIGRVKELQEQWNSIGFVPFKMKDKLYAEYREQCDALYNAYNSRESRQRMENFSNRVNEIKGDGQKVRSERDRLVRALDSRRNDLNTIENNMGFFNVKSSAGSSLVKEMENRIKRLKDDIRELEEKIAMLDSKD
ncbi:MAG: DUF349 domain-containing protein [Muribaculaceae bacterium]|nr:DUF349 domain-containing protein [Muribaculaceae bacterium]